MNCINSKYIDDKNESKNNVFKKVIFLLLFVVSSFILILIGMHIQNKYFNKSRIKAKELEDSFNFSKRKNLNNNEILLY
jgi:hypothetical protein